MNRFRSYSLPTTNGDQVRLGLVSDGRPTLDDIDCMPPWSNDMALDPPLSPFFVAPTTASEHRMSGASWTSSSTLSESLLTSSDSLLGFEPLLSPDLKALEEPFSWMKSDLTGMANANNQGDLAFPSANNSTPSMSMTGSQLPWATCLPSPPESGAGEDFFVAPTIDDAMALLGSSVPSPGMSEPLSSPLSRLNRPRSHSLSPHSSRPPLSPMMDGDNKRIKCPHCDKIFLRQYQLKSHMVSHSTERPHGCPICPVSFARKHDLQRHVRTIHGLYKSYKCGQCPHTSVKMDTLYRHMVNESHTDVMASVTHGAKVVQTFSFMELESLILCQNSMLFDSANPTLVYSNTASN